ncbi:unnamed protein product, partial [Mesorhabditis spiculigera]
MAAYSSTSCRSPMMFFVVRLHNAGQRDCFTPFFAHRASNAARLLAQLRRQHPPGYAKSKSPLPCSTMPCLLLLLNTIREATLKLAQGQRHAEQLRCFRLYLLATPDHQLRSTPQLTALFDNVIVHMVVTFHDVHLPTDTADNQHRHPTILDSAACSLLCMQISTTYRRDIYYFRVLHLLHNRVQYVDEHMYKRLRHATSRTSTATIALTSIALT